MTKAIMCRDLRRNVFFHWEMENVPDYLCHRAENSMEADFPMYLMYNKVTGKTSFIRTCPQIRSSLCRPDIGLDGKLWTPFIHRSVSFFMKITGAKYRQKYFTDFTIVDKSVLSILNTKMAPPITWNRFADPAKYRMWSSPKHHARLVMRIPMQLILGNHRIVIGSPRRIVIPFHLPVEAV